MQISLKETAETEYWLRLLILSEYIDEKHGESILNDCLEIKKTDSFTENCKGKQKVNVIYFVRA